MLLDMVGQQQTAHEREMNALKESRKDKPGDSPMKRLPKPTLQKLTTNDNVEHFLATFERIAAQQDWPKQIWVMQVAGLLSGKAMATYAINYGKAKDAVLRRHEINEETYCQRFRQGRRKGDEFYCESTDWLNNYFKRWVVSDSGALEELVTIEQFFVRVPEDLKEADFIAAGCYSHG